MRKKDSSAGQNARKLEEWMNLPFPAPDEPTPLETVALHEHATARLDVMASEVSRRANQWRGMRGEKPPENVSRALLVEALVRLWASDEDALNYCAMITSELSMVPSDIATQTTERINSADQQRETIANRHGLSFI